MKVLAIVNGVATEVDLSLGLTNVDLANLEQFLAWDRSEGNNYFTQLTYTGEDLTNISVYTDNTATTKIFNTDITYSGGGISTIVTTRTSSGTVLTKTISYSGGDLVSIGYSQV